MATGKAKGCVQLSRRDVVLVQARELGRLSDSARFVRLIVETKGVSKEAMYQAFREGVRLAKQDGKGA